MSKQNLVSSIAGEFGMTKQLSRDVVDHIVQTINKSVVEEGEFTLPGLGRLSVVQRAARIGRNPRSGEEITIPARSSVKFKATRALVDALNQR